MNQHHVRISAHRGGGGPGIPVTRQIFEAAVATDAEYVELDIRRTRDGVLVVHHGARVGRWGPRLRDLPYERLCELTGHAVPQVGDVLALIAAAGRAVGHLDLKEVGCEDEVVALATETLGPDGFIVTTADAPSISHIRRLFPGVLTALSLGHASDQAVRLMRNHSCGRDALRRIRACGAHWLAVNHRLTGSDVLSACAAHGIPCMVWTVNARAHMTRFLTDPRVAVLVTDHPRRALDLRAGLADHGPPRGQAPATSMSTLPTM